MLKMIMFLFITDVSHARLTMRDYVDYSSFVHEMYFKVINHALTFVNGDNSQRPLG